MKTILISTLFVILSIFKSTAQQGQQVTISGPQSPIPQVENTYEFDLSSLPVNLRSAPYVYEWQVSIGGEIQNDDGFWNNTTITTRRNSIKVKWANTCIPMDVRMRVIQSGDTFTTLRQGRLFDIEPKCLGIPSNLNNTLVNCGTGPFSFCINPVGNATNLMWSFSNGTVINTLGTQTCVSATLPFSNNVTLTVTATRNDAPGFSTSSSFTISRPRPGIPVFVLRPTNICVSALATYSIQPAANAIKYRWTASSHILINGVANTVETIGTQVSVTGVSSGTAQLSVVAVSATCGDSPSISIPINIGSPNSNMTVRINGQNNSTPNFICVNRPIDISVSAIGATSYDWQVNSNGLNISLFQYSPGRAEMIAYQAGSFSVTVCARNNCNTGQPCSSTTPSITLIFSASNCQPFSYRVFPNPADENLYIDLPAKSSPEEDPVEVKLLDAKGLQASQVDLRNYQFHQIDESRRITIPVKHLPKGTYFLHVIFNKHIEKHQIVVGEPLKN